MYYGNIPRKSDGEETIFVIVMVVTLLIGGYVAYKNTTLIAATIFALLWISLLTYAVYHKKDKI